MTILTRDEQTEISYWLGGELIGAAEATAARLLVEQYAKRVSPDFAKALSLRLPERIYLTHLTQVMLIAAADYTEPERTKIINQCMIARGRLVGINMEERTAVVEREVLIKVSDYNFRVASRKVKVKLDLDLTPRLQVGDAVAVHLGYIADKLTPEDATLLSGWTEKVAR